VTSWEFRLEKGFQLGQGKAPKMILEIEEAMAEETVLIGIKMGKGDLGVAMMVVDVEVMMAVGVAMEAEEEATVEVVTETQIVVEGMEIEEGEGEAPVEDFLSALTEVIPIDQVAAFQNALVEGIKNGAVEDIRIALVGGMVNVLAEIMEGALEVAMDAKNKKEVEDQKKEPGRVVQEQGQLLVDTVREIMALVVGEWEVIDPDPLQQDQILMRCQLRGQPQ